MKTIFNVYGWKNIVPIISQVSTLWNLVVLLSTLVNDGQLAQI